VLTGHANHACLADTFSMDSAHVEQLGQVLLEWMNPSTFPSSFFGILQPAVQMQIQSQCALRGVAFSRRDIHHPNIASSSDNATR